jgi:hypothetical protein
MKNNGEQKMTKRFSSHPLRFLVAAVLFLICFNAYAQETMKFDSEAKKLEFIRQMLAKEKYLRPSSEDKHIFAPRCKGMMKDLLANKNFKAVEPAVRADSIDDPRMAKWRQCDREDLLGGPFVFRSLDLLGAPPYRWYRIELDGNKENGPEDMIYYNMSKDLPGSITGYTWVDLENCKIKNGFTVTGALQTWSRKPNAIYLNTLLYYKGELWALDFVDGYGIKLMRWLDRERMETCFWVLFKPE